MPTVALVPSVPSEGKGGRPVELATIVALAALFLAVLVLGLVSKTRNGFALRPQKVEAGRASHLFLAGQVSF